MNKLSGEWLFPVADYIDVCKKGEVVFEVLLPIVLSAAATAICGLFDLSYQSCAQLNDLLPTIISILIGFTISVVAIIISISEGTNNRLNAISVYTISNTKISYRRWILVNLVYYTFCEVIALIFSLALPLAQEIFNNNYVSLVSIFLYLYFMLRILFGIVKVLTKFYILLYKSE